MSRRVIEGIGFIQRQHKQGLAMAVYFKTDNAASLLQKFDERIEQKEPRGKITTWKKREGYYTHKAEDWKEKAFFKAAVDAGQLRFNIIRPQGEKIAVDVYGYYHGHLVETFLNHFDHDFTQGTATAVASANDKV